MISKFILRLLIGISIVQATGCGTEEPYTPRTRPGKQEATARSHQYDYAVFLENSGSLNGYLNVAGDSNFKANMYRIIMAINDFPQKKSLDLFDINTALVPVAINADAQQLSQYMSNLNAAKFRERSKANGGNQEQSNLQDVIRRVTDSAGAGKVCILITDGVFSPGSRLDAVNYLEEQRGSIHAFLSARLKAQPIATLVLQFYSEFNGKYYFQDNSYQNGMFKQRPYYLLCYGPEQALLDLLRHVQQQELTGFQHFLLLTPVQAYAVNPHIRPFGSYYEYDAGAPLVLSQPSADERDHKFKIKVGVDFSLLPVDEAYKRDRGNYAISKGYSIDSIFTSDKNGYSHEIILAAERVQHGPVQVSLKRKLPDWIEASNLSTDKGLSPEMLEGKTFGIQYLLDGMADAYSGYTRFADFFSFTISVK